MTRLVADFHLHIYKVYPLETLLRALVVNLNRIAGPPSDGTPVVKAVFLAERRRYRIFQDWHRGHFRVRGFTLTPRGPHAIEIKTDKGDRLLLFAGRQVATAEGRIVGPDGKLYAHATTTCLIFDHPVGKQPS